jgi:hypothetical protein
MRSKEDGQWQMAALYKKELAGGLQGRAGGRGGGRVMMTMTQAQLSLLFEPFCSFKSEPMA